jgi:hypothetical protein
MAEPSPEKVDDRTKGSNWLLGLAILAAASVAAWLLAAYAHWPIAAAIVMIAAVGGVLYRTAHANAYGVALWCLAILLISLHQWTPISEYLPGSKDAYRGISSLFLVTGCIVFLVRAAKYRHSRAANCAGCVLAFYTLCFCAAVSSDAYRLRTYLDCVDHTTHILITLHKLANDIEAIRTRIGRLPANEAELVQLRGEPMPIYYGQYRINYYLRDSGIYDLSCCENNFWGSHWDIFGWILHYYGPQSTQRLHAEVF